MTALGAVVDSLGFYGLVGLMSLKTFLNIIAGGCLLGFRAFPKVAGFSLMIL